MENDTLVKFFLIKFDKLLNNVKIIIFITSFSLENKKLIHFNPIYIKFVKFVKNFFVSCLSSKAWEQYI